MRADGVGLLVCMCARALGTWSGWMFQCGPVLSRHLASVQLLGTGSAVAWAGGLIAYGAVTVLLRPWESVVLREFMQMRARTPVTGR